MYRLRFRHLSSSLCSVDSITAWLHHVRSIKTHSTTDMKSHNIKIFIIYSHAKCCSPLWTLRIERKSYGNDDFNNVNVIMSSSFKQGLFIQAMSSLNLFSQIPSPTQDFTAHLVKATQHFSFPSSMVRLTLTSTDSDSHSLFVFKFCLVFPLWKQFYNETIIIPCPALSLASPVSFL